MPSISPFSESWAHHVQPLYLRPFGRALALSFHGRLNQNGYGTSGLVRMGLRSTSPEHADDQRKPVDRGVFLLSDLVSVKTKNAHVVWSITLLVLIQFAFVFCVLPRHHTNICALAERHVKSKSGVGVGELEGGGRGIACACCVFFFLYDDLGPVQPRPVSIPDHLALPFLA